MAVTVDADLVARLDEFARVSGRSRSWVTAEALAEFIEANIDAVRNIRKGLEAAERGGFASDEEVAQFFEEWDVGTAMEQAGARGPGRTR